MKTTAVLLLLAFSALALAGTKPPGTVATAAFSNSPTQAPTKASPTTTTTTKAPTTTTTTTTTTTANTTTANTTTTTTTANTTTPNTTTANTTTTTTTANTTTANTTTPNTTTTTTTPNTTTPNTTTTTTTPNTTTPNTTTPAPQPPTITPPAKTNDTVGNYTLDNGGHRCLMAQMELKIRLVSEKASGTFLLLPNKTGIAGNCNDKNANLTLIFPEGSITFIYSKNVSQNSAFVNSLAFNLQYDFSKKSFAADDGTVDYKVDNQSIHLFNAKLGQSYSCRQESLYMGQGLYLDLSKDRMQAFNFTNSKDFGPTDPCSADQNNYRVAIAVGITLLVLIVVVVIAYLLARKKRTDGYQSL